MKLNGNFGFYELNIFFNDAECNVAINLGLNVEGPQLLNFFSVNSF